MSVVVDPIPYLLSLQFYVGTLESKQDLEKYSFQLHPRPNQ